MAKNTEDSTELKNLNFSLLNSIVSIYIHKSDYKKALKYSKISCKYITSSLYKAIYFNNIAKIFFCLKEFKSSIDFLRSALNLLDFINKSNRSDMMIVNRELLVFIQANYLNNVQAFCKEEEFQAELSKIGKVSRDLLGEFHPFSSKLKAMTSISSQHSNLKSQKFFANSDLPIIVYSTEITNSMNSPIR